MTEREKMIEIALDTEITGIKIRNITGGISTANTIADALIAAGIGDVKEIEHRAEIAEKALKLVSECDELSDAFCEWIGEDNCDFKCNTCLYNYFLQQAEREIEEEKK